MITNWVVEMYYQGKRDSVVRFKTKAEALTYYESKLSACKFGLVGWSVRYPREIQQ